jgi:hypothetical protein
MSRQVHVIRNENKYRITIPKPFLDLSGWLVKEDKASIVLDYNKEIGGLTITSTHTRPVSEEEEQALIDAIGNNPTPKLKKQSSKTFRDTIVPKESLPANCLFDEKLVELYKECEEIQTFLEKEEKSLFRKDF